MYIVKKSKFGLGFFMGSALAIGAAAAVAMSCPKSRRMMLKWISKGKRMAQNSDILL